MYEQPFNRTTMPFTVGGGDPAADPLVITALHEASESGLGQCDLVQWCREHQDYLLRTYQSSTKARALYDFEYVWLVLLSYFLVRKFEQDEPGQFAQPYMPFALADGQQPTAEDLYLLHTVCYAYAMAAPVQQKEGKVMVVQYVHELIEHVADKLGERLLLQTEAAPSAVRDVVAGGSIASEADTNYKRWFANIVDMSLRLFNWQPLFDAPEKA